MSFTFLINKSVVLFPLKRGICCPSFSVPMYLQDTLKNTFFAQYQIVQGKTRILQGFSNDAHVSCYQKAMKGLHCQETFPFSLSFSLILSFFVLSGKPQYLPLPQLLSADPRDPRSSAASFKSMAFLSYSGGYTTSSSTLIPFLPFPTSPDLDIFIFLLQMGLDIPRSFFIICTGHFKTPDRFYSKGRGSVEEAPGSPRPKYLH